MAPVPMNATTRIPLEDWVKNNPNNLKPNFKETEELMQITQFTRKQIRDYFVRRRMQLGITQARISRSLNHVNPNPAVHTPPVNSQMVHQSFQNQPNVCNPVMAVPLVFEVVPHESNVLQTVPAVHSNNQIVENEVDNYQNFSNETVVLQNFSGEPYPNSFVYQDPSGNLFIYEEIPPEALVFENVAELASNKENHNEELLYSTMESEATLHSTPQHHWETESAVVSNDSTAKLSNFDEEEPFENLLSVTDDENTSETAQPENQEDAEESFVITDETGSFLGTRADKERFEQELYELQNLIEMDPFYRY